MPVLILVLMEDALRVVDNRLKLETVVVLILVLMEDALRDGLNTEALLTRRS